MRATHAHASAPSPGVNFYGPLGIVGGLGSAARGHLAALEAASVPVSVIPVNEMFVHHSGVGLPQPKAERPKHRIAFVHANADLWSAFFISEREALRARNTVLASGFGSCPHFATSGGANCGALMRSGFLRHFASGRFPP